MRYYDASPIEECSIYRYIWLQRKSGQAWMHTHAHTHACTHTKYNNPHTCLQRLTTQHWSQQGCLLFQILTITGHSSLHPWGQAENRINTRTADRMVEQHKKRSNLHTNSRTVIFIWTYAHCTCRQILVVSACKHYIIVLHHSILLNCITSY